MIHFRQMICRKGCTNLKSIILLLLLLTCPQTIASPSGRANAAYRLEHHAPMEENRLLSSPPREVIGDTRITRSNLRMIRRLPLDGIDSIILDNVIFDEDEWKPRIHRKRSSLAEDKASTYSMPWITAMSSDSRLLLSYAEPVPNFVTANPSDKEIIYKRATTHQAKDQKVTVRNTTKDGNKASQQQAKNVERVAANKKKVDKKSADNARKDAEKKAKEEKNAADKQRKQAEKDEKQKMKDQKQVAS